MEKSSRRPLTPSELFVLIEKEFRRKRPAGCEACYVTMPYRVDVRDDGRANWELLPPAECLQRCVDVLEEIVTRMAQRYDLAAD